MQKILILLIALFSIARANATVPFCSISRSPDFGNTMLGEHDHRLDFLNLRWPV